LLIVQFVHKIPVSVNHTTSSEKSTLIVNHVLVYHVLLLLSIGEGCVLSIHVTVASIAPVSIPHDEYSKRKFPIVLKI
jgi:hypothetical protein